jgi:DNA-directed RNA polymerase specialized sigma24 family protein
MSDPFVQSFSFGTAFAEDVEAPTAPSADIADTAHESPSEPPPSQVRVGEPEAPANDTIDRTVLFKRLSDPRLRRDLLSYLIKKKELPPHRADDVLQKAYLRAIQARTWPEEAVKMFGWMIIIADRSFVDDVRKGDRRAAFEELQDDMDVVQEPRDDEEARHVAEVADKVAAESTRDAQTLRMLRAQADGERLTAILAQSSITKDTFYRRKARFVAAVKKRLVEIASMTTASLGLFLMLHILTVVTFITVAAPPPMPSLTDALPALPEHEDAETLRGLAHTHCLSHSYDRCLELLNRARRLDPKGDTDAKVVSDRQEAEAALRGSH